MANELTPAERQALNERRDALEKSIEKDDDCGCLECFNRVSRMQDELRKVTRQLSAPEPTAEPTCATCGNPNRDGQQCSGQGIACGCWMPRTPLITRSMKRVQNIRDGKPMDEGIPPLPAEPTTLEQSAWVKLDRFMAEWAIRICGMSDTKVAEEFAREFTGLNLKVDFAAIAAETQRVVARVREIAGKCRLRSFEEDGTVSVSASIFGTDFDAALTAEFGAGKDVTHG